MSLFRSGRRVGQSNVQTKLNLRKARRLECACEAVEGRVLLSGATFGTPNSVSLTGARGPLIAAKFNGSSSPIDVAVATPTTVQILTGSSNGTFSLGSSIAFPANPAAESPFHVGNFTGSGSEDIVLDSHNTGTGNGTLTYEANNGDATFTVGTVTSITDGGAGFTPIVGKIGDFNGDGESDLAIIGKPETGSQLVLAILMSNGDQTFTETDYPIAGSNAAGNTSNEEIFTAITGEIVVYDGSGGNLDVFSGPGDGTFTQLSPTPLAANLIVEGIYGNLQDLVVADGDQISLLVNQGDGTFQPDPQGAITLPGPITAMAAGDFSLNGADDLLTNEGILFGHGDGTFNTTPQALPVSINGGSDVTNTVEAVDILGNGKVGFVGFSAGGNAVVSAVNQTLAAVSIDLESTNNPANPGSDITFTATVSSSDNNITTTPTGNVTFFNGSTNLGTASVVDGTATLDVGSSASVGANSITAQYSGDATFAADTSAAFTQTVLAPTITTVVSNENPSLAGDDVIFTATVTGDDGAGDVPSGNVEFFDNGVDLGGGDLDDTGTATFDTAGSLALGAHPITAQYQADSNFAESLSTVLTQAVNQPGLVPLVTKTTLPAAIVEGNATHGTVTITLNNQTSSEILADNITVFASSNGEIDGATPLVSDISKHGIPILAGKTKVLTLTVKSTAGLSDGTYSLLVQVSSSLDQDSNSVTGPTVSVAAPFVDLSAVGSTGIVKPNPVTIGKAVTLTITLENSGNIPTSGAASVEIGLSTDGQTESTSIETTAASIRIRPGKSGVVHLHFKIPTTVEPASYQPFVTITDDGDVTTVIGQVFVVEA